MLSILRFGATRVNQRCPSWADLSGPNIKKMEASLLQCFLLLYLNHSPPLSLLVFVSGWEVGETEPLGFLRLSRGRKKPGEGVGKDEDWVDSGHRLKLPLEAGLEKRVRPSSLRAWVKTNGIPLWDRCTTHFRTYLVGVGMLTGYGIFDKWPFVSVLRWVRDLKLGV